MLSEVCKYIEIEPKLTTLTGKELDSRNVNTKNEMRLEVGAGGVWERGNQAFFDIRVFDLYPSSQVVARVSRNEGTRKEKSIQWESFANWTWYIYTIAFFNLWKYGEGMP